MVVKISKQYSLSHTCILLPLQKQRIRWTFVVCVYVVLLSRSNNLLIFHFYKITKPTNVSNSLFANPWRRFLSTCKYNPGNENEYIVNCDMLLYWSLLVFLQWEGTYNMSWKVDSRCIVSHTHWIHIVSMNVVMRLVRKTFQNVNPLQLVVSKYWLVAIMAWSMFLWTCYVTLFQGMEHWTN